MRYFEKNRRTLMKNHYVCGTPKSDLGTDSLDIISSSGAPITRLLIKGKTKQQCNMFSRYSEYFTNLDNYVFGGVGYTYVVPFPEELVGKELTFSLVEKTKMNDITFDLADGSGLFANTKSLLSYGETAKVTSSEYSYFRFTSVISSEKTEITDFWNNYILIIDSKTDTIEPAPNAPQIVLNAGDFGMTISINDKKISIPTSVTANGKNVPLLFSNFDELTIDKVNNKVEYIAQSCPYTFKGTEAVVVSDWCLNKGYGNYYLTIPNKGIMSGVSQCTHFKKGAWTENYAVMKNQTNVCGYTSDYYIWFRTDGVQSVEEFKAWLKAQYEADTPVYAVLKLRKATTYDITKTELGQALLSLCVPRGENGTLEVSGAVGDIPIELTYYSTEDADMVNITIRYLNSEGKEIAEPKIHNVRQGSKYLIVAPHIDGYTRVSSEVFGVADEDTVIELIYQK